MLGSVGRVCSVRLSALLPCTSGFLEQVRCTRRTTFPPPWIPKKYSDPAHQRLTKRSEDFLAEKAKIAPSPLKQEPWVRGTWDPKSKRTGLLAKKIGVYPQWTKKGVRMLCTLLQVLDNHVVSYLPPDVWYRVSKVGKRKAYSHRRNSATVFGRVTVGAGAADPQKFTNVYRRQFSRAGVLPKEHLASFMVTENAKLEPGTRLYATHFRVGQFVDVTGRSIDWGFQGGMHRWGWKGGPADNRGSSKFHRRGGSMGASGDRKIHPGKRMSGHMGWEWTHLRGIKLVRIDTEHQILFVKGGVPGDMDEILLIKDSCVDKKAVENPPFPTHYPEEDTEPLLTEYFDQSLHQFTEPTIMFDETEEEIVVKSKDVKKQAKAKKK